jgi:hypothetical protein
MNVFELSPDADGSWTQRVLYIFKLNGRDGDRPQIGLVFDTAGNLCGTTDWGGVLCHTNGLPGCGTALRSHLSSGKCTASECAESHKCIG